MTDERHRRDLDRPLPAHSAGAHPADLRGDVPAADIALVLCTLEEDQLAEAKAEPLSRRRLRGGELAVLWALRIYLLFMIGVVGYQLWKR
jgi:hypothetical protein